MSIKLIRFFYSFLALCAAGCLGQDGGLEGEGRSLAFLVRLDGRVHHAVDQFAIGDADRLEQIEGQRTGDGIDLVDVDLVFCLVDDVSPRARRP